MDALDWEICPRQLHSREEFRGTLFSIPHSFERRFLFAAGPPFEKGPAIENRTMLNLYPASDSAQVFERDSSSGALGVSNDPLRNTVVQVAGKARFFTRKLSPSAASRLGWFLGQPRRKPPVAMANAFHSGAAVVFSLRVAGDLSDSEVHSQELPRLGRIRRFDLASCRQKPVPAVEDQVGLPSRGQPAQLPLPGSQRNLGPSSERAERNGSLIDVPPQIPVVEGQTAEEPEGAFPLLIQLVGIRHFRNTADYDLSRQFESACGPPSTASLCSAY